MSKLIGSCLVCGATTNLNTTKIKYEEKEYDASVCMGCEDETPPKKLREYMKTKFAKFFELIEKAKEMNVELTLDMLIGTPKLIVATPKIAVEEAIPAAATEKRPKVAPQSNKTINLRDEKGNQVPATTFAVTKQKIDAPMAGRSGDKAGLQTEIPQTIISNSGTLHVSVRKMSSKEFDDRFRAQAHRSVHGTEDLTKLNPCRECNGDGWTGDKKKPILCKRCDGRGAES